MWFLEEQKALEIRKALAGDTTVTVEMRAKHTESEVASEAEARSDTGMPRNMRIAGDVAEIRIEGILTPKFDVIAWLFGGGNTTYEQIQSALAIAEADPIVRRVEMFIDSPGGSVAGLFETVAAIEAFKKPITVRASYAASAAYTLAAAAGKITAISKAASFGSVGVVQTFYADEQIVDVTSTEAPKKRPDITTEEGKAIVREYLDAIHQLVVESIAAGRSRASGQEVTPKKVNAEFGRGAMLIARDAKARNMIDKAPRALRVVGTAAAGDPIVVSVGADGIVRETENPPAIPSREVEPTDSTAAVGGETVNYGGTTSVKETETMTSNELKAQHPELYATVLEEGRKTGFAAGREDGVTAERKRVKAHLHLGSKCAAMDIALKAIDSGASTLDEEVHAAYLEAGINNRDRQTRQSESDAAGEVVDGATVSGGDSSQQTGDLGDQVVALMDARKGEAA
jgi:ClpP class serine protease